MRPDAQRFYQPDAWRAYAQYLPERKDWQSQPRVPAGSREGGQWADGGDLNGTQGGLPPEDDLHPPDGQPALVQLAQAGGTLTDAYGYPYYNPGGHHEVPEALLREWKAEGARPETLAVLNRGTTDTVPELSLRTNPSGESTRHVWNGALGRHGQYSEAVQTLSDQFLRKNNITVSEMTPDHARALLKEIRESNESRIRNYNAAIRTMRNLFVSVVDEGWNRHNDEQT